MKRKYDEIAPMIIDFCNEKLNNEYKDLCLRVLEKLCRKRSAPLLGGRVNTWAAGIIHAIGSNNFLFDKTQKLHITPKDIATTFGIAVNTVGSKANEIKKMLNISYFNPEWQTIELIDDNPMLWMVQINGIIVDIRDMAPEIQQQAFEMGIIPYIPENKINKKELVTESNVQKEIKNDHKTQKKQKEENKEQLNLDLF